MAAGPTSFSELFSPGFLLGASFAAGLLGHAIWDGIKHALGWGAGSAWAAITKRRRRHSEVLRSEFETALRLAESGLEGHLAALAQEARMRSVGMSEMIGGSTSLIIGAMGFGFADVRATAPWAAYIAPSLLTAMGAYWGIDGALTMLRSTNFGAGIIDGVQRRTTPPPSNG